MARLVLLVFLLVSAITLSSAGLSRIFFNTNVNAFSVQGNKPTNNPQNPGACYSLSKIIKIFYCHSLSWISFALPKFNYIESCGYIVGGSFQRVECPKPSPVDHNASNFAKQNNKNKYTYFWRFIKYKFFQTPYGIEANERLEKPNIIWLVAICRKVQFGCMKWKKTNRLKNKFIVVEKNW